MTNLRRIVLEHRRIVYILAAALVINAALYGLVVYPLAQRVQSGEQEAGDSTRDLNAARKTFDAARGTVTGKKEADAELAKFYQEVLPGDFSAARRRPLPAPRSAGARVQSVGWRLPVHIGQGTIPWVTCARSR